MAKKEPLYPHKTPSQLKREGNKTVPRSKSEEELEVETAEIMALTDTEISSAEAREKATGMGGKIGVLLETPTRTSVRTVVLFKSSEEANKFSQWIQQKGAILILEDIVWYVKYRATGNLSLIPPFERTRLVGDTAKSLRIIGETTGKFAGHDITEVMYDEKEEEWRLAIFENEYYAGQVANTLADWLREQGYEVAGVFNEWAVIFKTL
jgi:hypothetical protein